jgi:membrane peptidoglycan carboxypeptidase
MSLTVQNTPLRWDWVGVVLHEFRGVLACTRVMAARGIRRGRDAALRWRRPAGGLLLSTALIAAILAGIGFYRIYLDRTNLPDLEPFVRFDFPTIGHIYDTNGQPLMEMATEYRWISRYEEIPRVISGAILAAEDKNFFSHIRSDPDGVG